MTSRFSVQEFIHWFESGGGARWIRIAALLVAFGLLTLFVGFKQFRGATSEETLRQADLGWQIASGEGFTTRIKYPRTAAWLTAQGEEMATREVFPELELAPLYPLVIAATIKCIPEGLRTTLFTRIPTSPSGFGGDYLLLGLNLLLLWVAAALLYDATRRLFDGKTALAALFGFVLSASTWTHAVAVTGVPLMMVLVLALFGVLVRIEIGEEEDKTAWLGWGVAGVLCGLMFLCDYPAGTVLIVVAGYAVWILEKSRRWQVPVLVTLCALVVVTPWIVRNVKVSGMPVGLAWQDIATRKGDPTAEPDVLRTTFSAKSLDISLPKVGNKCLTAVETAFKDQLWSGGGLFLAAFFVTGWLYRFRRLATNRLRWFAVALILVLVPAYGSMNSGEGERLPIIYLAPLIVIFGAGFFWVLAVSSLGVMAARWSVVGLIFAQALPLTHDLMEPRRAHFSYPPYFPGLFMGVRQGLADPSGNLTWMVDVPGGAAWYGGGAVWAKTDKIEDFYQLSLQQNFTALMLSPRTLDRPYFSELAPSATAARNLGSWEHVYAGLNTNQFPPTFTLRRAQRVTDNVFILMKAQR